MKLWVFGASNCLPWKLSQADQSWMHQLAHRLDADLELHAHEACDNLYIYHKICQNHSRMHDDDCVVVGWTHPNRKTWVMDTENPKHQELCGSKDVLVYQDTPTFFRAYNNSVPSLSHWLKLKPKPQGQTFFDQWFQNYYSRHEQDLNLQSYMDSASLRLPKRHVFFYFSSESVAGVTDCPERLCYLDWVQQKQVNISQDDMHANPNGHAMLCQLFYQSLSEI